MKFSEMDGKQKAAALQVKHCFNQIVGGYENAILDGETSEMPSHDDLASEIYDGVMMCGWGEGWQGGPAIKEVRFAGSEFIKACIEARLGRDGL